MIYQLMFAIITPALISGAYAERIKFSTPCCCSRFCGSSSCISRWRTWCGAKAGLLNASLGGQIPTFDFAGGTVVHITSGVSALVCALYLGKRRAIRASQCGRTTWF